MLDRAEEMRMTRICKILFVGVILLALARWVPIYYKSYLYQYFVQEQVQRGHSKNNFKQTVLDQAKAYAIPVNESDIVIRMTGALMRVIVDSHVPADALESEPILTFHVIASGLVRE